MHFYTFCAIVHSTFYKVFRIYIFSLEMTMASGMISDSDVRDHFFRSYCMKLELSREEILEKLIRSYEGYFDIERSDDFEPPLQAVCHFNVRSAKYVLLKKAELWSATSNEHVYIFSVPELTEEIYRTCEKKAYEEGMKLIDPKPGHMYTYITAVFICDSCTPEAKKLLKKCRIYKSFHFSLHGWMDFHTVLIQRGESDFPTNRSGKSNAKFMKNIFMKKNKKKRRV